MIVRSRSLLVVPAVALALVLAACGGGDDGDAGGDAAGPGGGEIDVTGTDGLEWQPEELQAAAGEVTVNLTCEQAVNHTFVIEEVGDQPVAECAAGESVTEAVELEAGTYTFYCDVPGHREAGMEGPLEVGG